MHQMFPDWIRTLTADGDLTNSPWESWGAGVDGYLAEANHDDLIQLVRCAHGIDTGSWDVEWREHLREHDPAFPLRDQHQLVSVLAGAAIITAREAEESASATVALYGAVCAGHAGWTPTLTDVRVDSAALEHYAREVRETPPWRASRVQVTATGYEEELPAADAAVTSQQAGNALAALAKSTTEAFDRLQAAIGRVAEQREVPLREEVAVLRWLLSGFSAELGGPWQQFTADVVALAAAKELDGLTRFGIGLPDARALLQQTVALSSGTGRSDLAITAQPSLADLTPIASSVAGGSEPSVEPSDLAVRLYDELRLVAAYERDDE